jgi:hypothetical protein
MLRRLLAKSHEARPVLGRWSLKYDEHQVNRVVHYANEDHCGCCTNLKSNLKSNPLFYKLELIKRDKFK